jgi:hypothetical protein
MPDRVPLFLTFRIAPIPVPERDRKRYIIQSKDMKILEALCSSPLIWKILP